MLHQPNFATLYSRRRVLTKLKGQQNLAIQTYMHILDVHMCILCIYIYIKSLSIFDTINMSLQTGRFFTGEYILHKERLQDIQASLFPGRSNSSSVLVSPVF